MTSLEVVTVGVKKCNRAKMAKMACRVDSARANKDFKSVTVKLWK